MLKNANPNSTKFRKYKFSHQLTINI